jgi:hypothetical protein
LIVLPFGPISSPILSTGMLTEITRGAVGGHLIRLVDRGVQHRQDRRARILRLLQGSGEDV